jgi:hypothetical protein
MGTIFELGFGKSHFNTNRVVSGAQTFTQAASTVVNPTNAYDIPSIGKNDG